MTTIELLAFAIAIVICTAGAAAIAAYLLRSRSNERLLFWFGAFSGIYGVRMFFKQPLASALGIDTTTALWGEDSLNYFILVPALLFIEELYGPGWRGLLRWITRATAVLAVVAMIVDIASGDPRRVPDPSLVVLVPFAIVVLAGIRAGYRAPHFPEWPVLLAGIAAFLLLVINEHAVSAGIVPWRIKAEPIGFLVQVGCFGYIALSRVVAQGHQLAAIDQEMRSAREIQASILPRTLPALQGVPVAARYVPLAAVAGDLYDVVALDGGDLAVLVADVSGHGVPAALIASMVKVAFTAGIGETHDPGAVLGRMNAALAGMFERAYVTAACAVLRPDGGTLTYALAGHPPPILLSPQRDSVELLDARGLVLGFLPAVTYTSATVKMEPGARLIIYTDGVTEAPGRDGDLFDLDRLAAFAIAERHRSAEAFADALIESLKRFAHAETLPHDDVTLVVVDVTGA